MTDYINSNSVNYGLARLTIQNLSKSFGERLVLDNLSLQVEDRESLVILGQSGTGKSVLLQCIAGLLYPEQGKITVDQQDLIKRNIFTPRQNHEVSIGMLFQNSALFDSLSVWENITFGVSEKSESERKQIATQMLELVNLKDDIIELYPAEVSGGMQKRISLARTIVTKPKIILFDEPTAGLDPIIANIINDLITKTIKYLNATAITVTHDLNTIQKVASKVAFIKDKNIYWHGTLSQFNEIQDQEVLKFVRGEY